MFFWRKNHKNAWYDTAVKGIERLENGDLTALREVYCVFALDHAGLVRRAGETVERQLSRMTRPRLFQICMRFRDLTSMEWSIDWAEVSPALPKKTLSKEAYRYVLILGTFHPNGYFRERCLYELAAYDGMLFWIFPRVNDWVWQIREAACRILKNYLVNCDARELLDALPALEHLQRCHRRTEGQMQELEAKTGERFSQVVKEMDLHTIPQMEPEVRSALYRRAVRAGLLSLTELELCLEQEKAGCLKRILIRKILSHPDCTLERAEHYLGNSSSQVRKLAVEFRYERLKNAWTGLEKMLLDRSRGVREYAAYILERHSDLDIRGYYLAHLKDEKPEYAIAGLSEYSRTGNVQALMGCLEQAERRVLKYTLLALGRQEDFTDEELLWKYLLDQRNEIAKEACLAIQKRDFYPGAERIYKAYTEAEAEFHRRYLLRLLLREGSWSRLPYLLRLYRRDLPKQEKYLILSGICSRSMYGKVNGRLQEEIFLALEEKREELPDGLEKRIVSDLKFLV